MKPLFIFLLLTASVFGQEQDLQPKLDSIIQEANRLYLYEKAVWEATDLLMEDKSILDHYGGYVANIKNDTVSVTFAHVNGVDKIAVFRFTAAEPAFPFEVLKETQPLSKLEKKLFDTKSKVVSQLGNEDYEVSWPEGYNPNFILLPDTVGYKFYLIMGATESGVIPFGNDYVFFIDSEGTITNWKKIHSRMIPGQTGGPNGEQVSMLIHSHLRTSPYISATDICTFRLYAPDYGIDEFKVLCTATRSYYTYSLKNNSITVEKMD